MSQFVCDHRGVHEIQNVDHSGHYDPQQWLVNSFGGGGPSESGIVTTPRAILSHVPIWQGINILAGDVGMLPLMLKRRIGNRTTDNTSHVAYQLVSRRPNPLMCPNVFLELLMMRAILHGNGIAEVARDPMGNPLPGPLGGLTPLIPEKTKPEYDENGKLWIVTRVTIDGQERARTIDPQDTVHIKGLSDDGIWGLSLRQVASDSIGYGLALRKHGNVTFKNRARPDLLVSTPERLSDQGKKNLRESWGQIHQGLDNVARMAILEEGMTVTPFTQSNRDTRWIEAQKFDREQAASLLNIPAHMLNALERATFSNIEEQNRWYINRSLSRWLNKLTQEFAAKLLNQREQQRLFFFFNLDQLLKGTLKERMEAYSIAISALILNSNEVRNEEGFDPREGGEVFINPNTTTDGGQNPDDSEQVSDRVTRLEDDRNRLLAWNLRECMNNENAQVRRAARESKNFLSWLDNFYQTEFRNRLSELIDTDVAYEYCVGRHEMWLTVSGEVDSSESLVDAVDKMKGDVRERGRTLLNMELRPCE